MTSLASKLKGVGMTVEEPFLVQFIIKSLPFDQYGPFQLNYNTLKDKWTVHKLSGMLIIQEEQRIKDNKTPTVHLVNHNGASTRSVKKSGGGKGKKKGSPTQKAFKGTFKKTSKEKCNFCRKDGHFQKDCIKRHNWFEKKGIPFNPDHKSK